MPGTYTNLLLHIVFSTHQRRAWLTPPVCERLYPFVGGIIRDDKGSLLAMGGMPDHVHLLVRWRTDETIAELVRSMKVRSSKWMHAEFPRLRAFAWQEGYGAFTVSKSQEGKVRRYIANQERHHTGRNFKAEFRELLEAHEVEYEEKYLWD